MIKTLGTVTSLENSLPFRITGLKEVYTKTGSPWGFSLNQRWSLWKFLIALLEDVGFTVKKYCTAQQRLFHLKPLIECYSLEKVGLRKACTLWTWVSIKFFEIGLLGYLSLVSTVTAIQTKFFYAVSQIKY